MSDMTIYRQLSSPCSRLCSHRCAVQGRDVNIHHLEPQISEQDKRKTFWAFSKGDAGWFVFGYLIGFLLFRFDMFGHGPWFRHPMPTAKAAWLALLFACVSFVLVKMRLAGSRVDE